MAARISDVKIDVNAASSPSNSPGADKGVEVGNSTLDQRDGLVPDQYLFTGTFCQNHASSTTVLRVHRS